MSKAVEERRSCISTYSKNKPFIISAHDTKDTEKSEICTSTTICEDNSAEKVTTNEGECSLQKLACDTNVGEYMKDVNPTFDDNGELNRRRKRHKKDRNSETEGEACKKSKTKKVKETQTA